MTSPPSRPRPRVSTSMIGHARSPIRTSPRSTVTASTSTPSSRAAIAASFAWTSRHASSTAFPISTDERLADVCWSYGHDRRVAADDRDPVDRRPQLLGGDLGEDRARALAHVRGPGGQDDAAVDQQPDRGVGEAGGRALLEADRDAPAAARRHRRSPADPVGGPPHRLGPLAVRRRVAGDERVAAMGEVPEPQLERVDAQPDRRLVEVRLDRPDLLRVAEAAEGRRRDGVREQAPRADPDGRGPVRPVRGVAALGDDAVRDVGVGADEVVRLDVAEGERAVAMEARPDADLGGRPPDGLERLLEREHEPHGPPGAQRHERQQRLVLRVLLAAEPAARVGREHADPRQRQVEQRGDDALEPVRVLDRAPDGDAVAVRGGDEGVRLDRELGDHREGRRCPRRRPRPRARRPRGRPSRTRARGACCVSASGSPGRSDGSWTSGDAGSSAAAIVTSRPAAARAPRRPARRPPRRRPGSRRRPPRPARRGRRSSRRPAPAGRGAAARSAASGRGGRRAS